MPFVRRRKQRKRLRRLVWQKPWPKDPQLRTLWEIGAKYQAGFSRAFLSAMRGVLDVEHWKAFKLAYGTGNVDEVMATLPFYSEMELASRPELPRGWQRFQDQMVRAYAKVIQDAGDAEMKNLKRDFGVTIPFSLAEEKIVQKAWTADGRFIPTVPVNPYSQEWMEQESLGLITQGLNETQRVAVRGLLVGYYSTGVRAEEAFKMVKNSIGLTDRYTQAVEKRRQLHIAAGLSPKEVDRLTAAYAAKLLKSRAITIARTEMIAAQAHGRNASWQMAMDAGQLPIDVERLWITGPETADPNAPCAICRPLDLTRAPLGQEYAPGIKSPPAHPRCRCTERLVRKKTNVRAKMFR